MDPSNSPPVPHMLRPHHVGIILFLIEYQRGLDWGEKGQVPRPLHKKVKQRMLSVLAREIGEVCPCHDHGRYKLSPHSGSCECL